MQKSKVSADQARVVQILRDLVAIDSVNPALPGGRQGEAEVARYVADFCCRLGLDVSFQEVLPGRANVIARLDVPGARRTLLYESHLDTATMEGYPDALDPRLADGRVYGRGSCDTKGGLAGMLHALELLQAQRGELECNVVLAGAVDEEHLMRGSAALARLPLQADGAVIAEPTSLSVIVAHKGLLRPFIQTTGRAAHSSDPEAGDNAIYQMAEVIRALRERLEPSLARLSHPLCGHPTISVGTIRGGLQVNFVAPDCSIHLDRRLLPQEDPDAVLADFVRFLADLRREQPWIKVSIAECAHKLRGLDTPPSSPIARAAEAASREVLGWARVEGVPYATDASNLAEGGIAGIVLGPGSIAQAHTMDEWVPIAELVASAEVYARIARSFPAAFEEA